MVLCYVKGLISPPVSDSLRKRT